MPQVPQNVPVNDDASSSKEGSKASMTAQEALAARNSEKNNAGNTSKKTDASSSKEGSKASMTAQEMEEMRNQLREEMKQEMKEEVKKELISETGAKEVNFEATVVENSDVIAEKLNKEEKVLVVWDLEEGVPVGFMEEVKINGAVARIPRGISLYAPISVAKMIGKYIAAESNPDQGVKDRRGANGVRLDRDEVAKAALA